MTKNIKNKSLMDTQLPNFIRSDYPVFVEFLKAYYDYLDSQKVHRNIETFRDIDTTITDFVSLLKNELAQAVPDYARDKFYLPLQGQHYVTRGTEESYKLLFKMLLQKDVEILYPSESILRVSDGKWTQDNSFFVTVSAGDANDIVGKYINVTTPNKNIRIYVERIKQITTTVYEVFFSRNYYGDIGVGNKVNYGSFKSRIVPTTTAAKVISKGTGFRLGQIFAIRTTTGTGSIAKISKVGVGGTIEQLQFIEFGTGYLAGSYYSLSSKLPQATPYSFPLSQKIKATATEAGYGAVSTDYSGTKTVVLSASSGTITLGARVKIKSSGADPSGGETYVFSYNSSTKTVVLSQNITVTSGTELSFSGTQITYNNPYPGYKDKTEGFVDGGYVNEQTYFEYTSGNGYVQNTTTTTKVGDPIQLINVTGRILPGMSVKIAGQDPVGGPTTVLSYNENTKVATFSRIGTWSSNIIISFESLPLYTEGNYAGEVVREFYALTVEDEIDEDAALVEIKTGPIARYPGYYYNNDSFISGVSYIQDSYYYQDFSYVIKVSEQLETYKNIVLSYLHPAGKKMFAEYVIENKFEIAPDIIFAILRKQFPEVVSAYETMNIFFEKNATGTDPNFNETVTITHAVPKLYVSKPLTDSVSEQDYNYKLTSKLINNSTLDGSGVADGQYVTALSEISSKLFGKPLASSQSSSDSITSKDFGKLLQTSQSSSDSITSKDFGKLLQNTQVIDDLVTTVLTAVRSASETITQSDATALLVGKNTLSSSSTAGDAQPTKSFDKSLTEDVINNDSGTAQWNPYYSQDYFLQDYQVGRRTF